MTWIASGRHADMQEGKTCMQAHRQAGRRATKHDGRQSLRQAGRQATGRHASMTDRHAGRAAFREALMRAGMQLHTGKSCRQADSP